MNRRLYYPITLTIVFTFITFGQIPRLMTHQGYIADETGPITNDTLPMVFRLYDDLSAGTLVKEISFPKPPGVIIIKGVYNVILDVVGVIFSKPLYLEITVNSEIQSPRLQLTSASYSQNSLTVLGPGCSSRDTNTVAGGSNNAALGEYSVVSGGVQDSASGYLSTVSGGGDNIARGDHSTISGGIENFISNGGISSTINGGENNIIESPNSVIGGGIANTINTDDNEWSTIGGGNANIIFGANSATIGGGDGNSIMEAADAATVAGGVGNIAHAEGASIGGGIDNVVTGTRAVIGGGRCNKARGIASVVSGGGSMIYQGPDTNSALGDYSVVPGGKANTASGDYSFAAGYGAKALHDGSFVWAGSTGNLSSTATNQFIISADNGVRFASQAGSMKIINTGDHYKDNGIVAWARIASGGTVERSFGVSSCVLNSTGDYTITIDAATNGTNLIPLATVEIDSPPTGAAAARLIYVNQLTTNSFNVYITNGNFSVVNNDFVFIATGR